MSRLLLALVVVILLFGAGTAIHVIWILAVICLILWVAGFLFRPGRHHWYFW